MEVLHVLILPLSLLFRDSHSLTYVDYQRPVVVSCFYRYLTVVFKSIRPGHKGRDTRPGTILIAQIRPTDYREIQGNPTEKLGATY